MPHPLRVISHPVHPRMGTTLQCTSMLNLFLVTVAFRRFGPLGLGLGSGHLFVPACLKSDHPGTASPVMVNMKTAGRNAYKPAT